MGKGELLCYTTDNGTNIVAAEMELRWPSLSCVAVIFTSPLQVVLPVNPEEKMQHTIYHFIIF